ncbi:alpha/beta hydrolase [Streptomyces sp. NPDC096012]|uniref:alpha/beta fold hydrolase n=1 Tax=Streptomyces sp. NPDC096012 TaxID=3155684 RepID=UPI00336A52E4
MSTGAEIANTVVAGGIATNYHDQGDGAPVLLIHGSGPGVSAWANWRPVIPDLGKRFRVIAPDILGFGYTERPEGVRYDMDSWLGHLTGLLDALELPKVSVVGNSFGGALALHLASTHPERVDRLVLMGSVGVPFEITEGLDAVWGYEPSVASMRKLLDIFAHDRRLATDELAELRYEASVRPGVHEAYSAMFPAPRQNGVDAMALPEDRIRAIGQETLVIHGRDDQIIPLSNSERLVRLIERSQLHVFGQCGHWVQIEHSARFNRLVGDFLAEG